MSQNAVGVDVRGVWYWFGDGVAGGGARGGEAVGRGEPPTPDAGVLALRDVHLGVQAGEFVSIVGVSGCGKSTLLRLVAGLLSPSRGEALVGGQRPQTLRARKGISWMSQQASLLPWRTVLENVTLPLRVNVQGADHGAAPHGTDLAPEQLLALVGLAEFAGAYPHALSGGMQQRAALARALATGASLWLMDEPFAALDELTRARLTEELLGLWRRFGATALWVTHNIHEAIRLSNRVVVMTPRPGTIAGVVEVDLPYPRDDTSAAFGNVLSEVRRLLHDEGRPLFEAFDAGEGRGFYDG